MTIGRCELVAAILLELHRQAAAGITRDQMDAITRAADLIIEAMEVRP